MFSPDVDVPHPDEKSIITYVSSLYDAMPRADAQDGARSSVSVTLLIVCVAAYDTSKDLEKRNSIV